MTDLRLSLKSFQNDTICISEDMSLSK